MQDFRNSYDEKLVNKPFEKPLGGYYKMSAKLRMLPDFFLIGAQKAGTTSLFAALCKHPQVLAPVRKEIYFFNNVANYNKGINWYRAHFPMLAQQTLAQRRHSIAHTFDATANYFEEPKAAKRIKDTFPNTKLVLMLRNPIERAFSHYRMAKKLGFEKVSFPAAIAQEAQRIEEAQMIDGHNYVYQRLGYVSKGHYADLLKPWLACFGPEQLLILRSEDFFLEPDIIFAQVCSFFGLDEFQPDKFEIHKQNSPMGVPRNIEIILREHFQPHIEALEQLLNRKMHWL